MDTYTLSNQLEAKLVASEASDDVFRREFFRLAQQLEAKVETLTTALREILEGSKPTGRWLDDDTFECPEGDQGRQILIGVPQGVHNVCCRALAYMVSDLGTAMKISPNAGRGTIRRWTRFTSAPSSTPCRHL